MSKQKEAKRKRNKSNIPLPVGSLNPPNQASISSYFQPDQPSKKQKTGESKAKIEEYSVLTEDVYGGRGEKKKKDIVLGSERLFTQAKCQETISNHLSTNEMARKVNTHLTEQEWRTLIRRFDFKNGLRVDPLDQSLSFS